MKTTTNYGLGLHETTDKVNFTGSNGLNESFTKIDAQMKANADKAAENAESVGTLETKMETIENNLSNHEERITALEEGESEYATELARIESNIDCFVNVPLTTRRGYLTSNGSLAKDSDPQEVYTDLIAVEPSSTLSIIYSLSEVKQMWIASVEYDRSNCFVRRTVLKTGNAQSVELSYEIPSDAYAIRLTYRTYGEEAVTLKKPYSDIRYELDNPIYENDNVKVINHRGYNWFAPENTLSAYRYSKLMGYDYVETDVAVTSDGVFVCLHDETIDRTSNGTGNIANMTFEEVRNYDFGSWRSNDYEGEKIPTLEEFFTLCKKIGLKAYVEFKTTASYTAEQVANIVNIAKKCGMIDNVTWISFGFGYLQYVANCESNARLGLVCNSITSTIVTNAKTLLASGNDVFIDASVFDDSGIELAMGENIPVEAWIVDTLTVLNSLPEYVTGYTTNAIHPDVALIYDEM